MVTFLTLSNQFQQFRMKLEFNNDMSIADNLGGEIARVSVSLNRYLNQLPCNEELNVERVVKKNKF